MFNPLVESFENLTDNQLDDKISELSRKYIISANNPALQQQILAVLEMHREEMRSRIAQKAQKTLSNDENDLDNLINIS